MALLRPVDGAELLKHHLAARQAYIVSCLTAATAGEGGHDPATLAVVLADVAELVCSTIAQCGELFHSRPGVTSRPLLVELASKEDLGASELLFDPGSAKESAESAAWKKHQAAACERLSSLASAGVALECSQWLESLAVHVAPLCEKLLEGCESGADLRHVEMGVQEALTAWRYRLGGSSTNSSSTLGASATPTPSISGTHSPTKLHVEELSITDTCQWVVGHPVSLWPLLFEGPLVSRAKGLVAAQFDAVGRQAGELIQAALSESLAQPPCAPGIVDPGRWCDALELAPDGVGAVGGAGAAGPVRRKASGGSIRGGAMARAESSGVGARGGAAADPRWWIPRAQALLAGVDVNLEAALTVALAVTSLPGSGASAPPQQGSFQGSAGAYSNVHGGKGGVSKAGPSPRAVVLQPFIQESCSAAVEAVASALEAATASLPDVHDAESFGAAACAALFIGRVAQGLADRSAPLRLLLGPPAAWAPAREAEKKASLQLLQRLPSVAATSSRAMEVTPRLDTAQRRLRGIAGKSYSLWAAWASRGLAEQLVLQAASDGALAADTALRGWEEAVLPGSAEAGGDVKFLLPASPSPAAMAAALGACSEIERAGGYAADDVPVQLLRWLLGGDICSALKAAFTSGGPFAVPGAVSEKGLLQLLFDLRFLMSLLEAVPPEGAPPAAAAGRVREVATAEAELAGHIDPIDWATYESHLYARVVQFSQRSKAVLGLASRGAPAPKPGSTAATAGAAPITQPADSNILRMAPPGPRFAYLPVNTPAALRQQRPQSAAPAPAAALLDDGEETQYSFASLSTGRSRPTSSADTRDGASGGSAAGVGAAAMEVLRQSTFGSLLGDKAAEMSATFEGWGGYSSTLSASGSGLLSSLTNLPSFKRG